MKAVARAIAALAAGGFGLLCTPTVAGAQVSQTRQPVRQLVSLAPGSIDGVVQDEKDAPVAGAVVSALGATRAFAVTDQAMSVRHQSTLRSPVSLTTAALSPDLRAYSRLAHTSS